jgi:hypothetical protein
MGKTDATRNTKTHEMRNKTKMIIGAASVAAAISVAGIVWYLTDGFRPRSPLGGPCRSLDDCAETATVCLKPRWKNMGVCTKQCNDDVDCGDNLKCRPQPRLHKQKPKKSNAQLSQYCFRAPKTPAQSRSPQ